MRRLLISTAACVLAVATSAAQYPYPAAPATGAPSGLRLQRELELFLVEHVQRHLKDPGDGLSLAADLRDLRRVRSEAGEATASWTGARAPADENAALRELAIVAELWSLRVNGRTAFPMMPRERFQLVDRAQAALSKLAQEATGGVRDRFVPSMQHELQRLRAYGAGQGELSEAAIDASLAIADAASTGRPVQTKGGYPAVMPPGQGPPAPPPGYVTPPPPGQPPGNQPPPPPLPPTRGQQTAPALPPGYAAYAQPLNPVCLADRASAAEQRDSEAMLRVADCWARDRRWPGWGAQALEAIEWAVDFAYLARNCAALDRAADRLRAIGPAASIYPQDRQTLTRITTEAEAMKAWLRARGVCR